MLLGWCAALFLYGVGAGPLYRTESLRAIIGAEALRGHWLYPVLHGEPFLTKPPGHYAAIGLASLPTGAVTDITARLPSVVAATVAVFLMVGLFRRTLGERAGVLVGLLAPCSVLWLDKAPSAEIDMTLVGWVTASLVLLHRALDAPRPRTAWLVGSLLCVAGGTLTKWTAPAFFALTIVPFLASRRQLRVLVGGPFLLATACAVAVVATWAALVAQAVGWDVLVETVRKEAAYRFAPKPGAKGYPWGEVVTYPLLVWAAHLPLSLFALRTLRRGFAERWDDRGRTLLVFLHCWAWPNLLFWALVPNHNVRYALPVSPALMGLGVMGALEWWHVLSPGGAAVRSPGRKPWAAWARGERERGADTANAAQGSHPGLSTAAPPGLEAPSQQPAHAGRSPVVALVTFLALWLAVKVVFVEVVVPRRTAGRDAAATAAQLRALVPAGEPLYLLKLKDEGVLFYYARPTRKVAAPAQLPRPAFVALTAAEWEAGETGWGGEAVQWMYDQQGDPFVLVRVTPP